MRQGTRGLRAARSWYYSRMIIALAFAALGAVVASFVGVIAERAYTGQSFAQGRSRCNTCARELGPLDLIPVVSWLLSQGRCFTCGAKVPGLYPAVEVALALSYALAYERLGLTVALPLFLAALATLAFIVYYDIRHTIVPPESSLLLILLSVAFAVAAFPGTAALGSALIGAGAIGLGFLLLHALSSGRAMGLGDAPVAFALSLLVAPYALAGLFYSFWIGALCGIVILLGQRRGHRMGIEVPFVPFLALGYILAFFIQWNPLAFL